MDRKAVESYCREYMDFLAKAKTERRAYAAAVALLTKAGFREISSVKKLKAGDKAVIAVKADNSDEVLIKKLNDDGTRPRADQNVQTTKEKFFAHVHNAISVTQNFDIAK